MFRPSKSVTRCPICGEPLTYETIDQFGVPVGYNVQCTECNNYSDIWVNGLREVQCGQWLSPDYESDYGAMTAREKWQALKILCELNLRLATEIIRYAVQQMQEPQIREKQVHA